MAVDASYREFVEDVLSGLQGRGVGRVAIKPMFGGAGVYADGVMFGLIAFDQLYFKADQATATDYEEEGCGQFVYEGKNKPIAMSYWQVPERLFEDPDELIDWATKALAIARSTPTKPRSRRKKASA